MDPVNALLILFLVFLVVLNALALWWVFWLFVPLVLRGAPFVPSHPERVKRMVALAQIGPDDCVVDLGSGDGRLVFAAAEAGAKQAIGYEINAALVRRCRNETERRGLTGRVTFKQCSFWDIDLHDADVILMYQIPYAMKRIGDKLRRELRPGSRIVSNAFTFPDWPPLHQEGNLYVYERPAV